MASKYVLSMTDKLKEDIHDIFLSLVTVFVEKNFEGLHSGC
jgi:hypothetical protein